MLFSYTLIPAYGRKYATMADMLKDWDAGKDFMVQGSGFYCSKRDALAIRRELTYAYLVGNGERLQVV